MGTKQSPAEAGECQARIRRGHWAEDLARNSCQFPVGPRNTWSNLSYPLVGAALYLATGRQEAAGVMALALSYLGLGSALYHGLKTRWANALDRSGMYGVFGALAAYAVGAEPLPMLLFAFACATLLQFLFALPTVEKAIGLLLVVASVPPALAGQFRLVGVAFLLYGLGYAAWHLDRRRSRLVGLWGHALWHDLTAGAIGVSFLAIYATRLA